MRGTATSSREWPSVRSQSYPSHGEGSWICEGHPLHPGMEGWGLTWGKDPVKTDLTNQTHNTGKFRGRAGFRVG